MFYSITKRRRKISYSSINSLNKELTTVTVTRERNYLDILIGDAIIKIGDVEFSPSLYGRRLTTSLSKGDGLICREHIMIPRRFRGLNRQQLGSDTIISSTFKIRKKKF